ncbi:MAG: class I SAM-dependent methyltransferase [Rhodanobacter sp.]
MDDSGLFSTDWFEHNVPHWQRWLGDFAGRPGVRALEVGSFEGRSTMWLCEHILTGAGSAIDCVDLFRPDPVYGEYPTRFRANTAAWRERITEYPGRSFDMLRQVTGPYDIVYIDGWHSAFGAMADGVMAWPLLKVGGVMIFDDYLWYPPRLGTLEPLAKPDWLVRRWAKLRGRDWRKDRLDREVARLDARIASVAVDTPKLGVDSLLATLTGHYELLGASYQLAVRRTHEFEQGQVGHDT